MRGQSERRFGVHLTHLERYRFESQAAEDGRPHGATFTSDEPDPVGDASAPATPALLAAALGHCLSASLMETMRHAHLPVVGFEADAVAVVAPNDEGLPRVDRVDVVLRPQLSSPSARQERSADVFEKHCTVTSSVRTGIQVNVEVDWCVAEPAAPLTT